VSEESLDHDQGAQKRRKAQVTVFEIETFTEFHDVVNRFALFPGLESLAAHIEWLQSKGY